MDNNVKKYLTIGTVVLLKNGKKRIMITGFCVIPEEDKNKMFDYTGVLFPEGAIDSKQGLMFDHNQIDKIYHLGLSDEEEKQFKEKLDEVISQGGIEKTKEIAQNTNNQPTQEIRISE